MVLVLDLASYQVIRTISTGAAQRPFGVALMPGDRLLYVTNASASTVSVIDTRSFQIVATVEVGDLPWDIVLQSAPAVAGGSAIQGGDGAREEAAVPRK